VTHKGSATISQEQWLANLLERLTEGYQPTGVLILVSVYAYFMAVCFLPPAPGQDALAPSDPEAHDHLCVCLASRCPFVFGVRVHSLEVLGV
jgi:hypothetical protein